MFANNSVCEYLGYNIVTIPVEERTNCSKKLANESYWILDWVFRGKKWPLSSDINQNEFSVNQRIGCGKYIWRNFVTIHIVWGKECFFKYHSMVKTTNRNVQDWNYIKILNLQVKIFKTTELTLGKRSNSTSPVMGDSGITYPLADLCWTMRNH